MLLHVDGVRRTALPVVFISACRSTDDLLTLATSAAAAAAAQYVEQLDCISQRVTDQLRLTCDLRLTGRRLTRSAWRAGAPRRACTRCCCCCCGGGRRSSRISSDRLHKCTITRRHHHRHPAAHHHVITALLRLALTACTLSVFYFVVFLLSTY